MTETYLGKGDKKPFETHGTFTFDKDNTSVITLDDKGQNRKFFIGENTATALDMEGKKIEGSLAEHYVLKIIIFNIKKPAHVSGFSFEINS